MQLQEIKTNNPRQRSSIFRDPPRESDFNDLKIFEEEEEE